MTGTQRFAPTALRYPRFEARSKAVHMSPTFRDYTARLREAEFGLDYIEFIERIARGHSLQERFYRSGIDTTVDHLLERTGIKHLHLGGRNSDVLLFVAEFSRSVLVLEINRHHRFDRDRVGSSLISNHGAVLTSNGRPREDKAA